MSEPGPIWVIETTEREASRQRADLRLWGLVTAIQQRANALVHQVEEPPAGFDPVFDQGEVFRRIAEIRRLLDESVMAVVFSGEAGHD